MIELLEKWLFDPTVGKIIAVVTVLVIVGALVKFVQRSLGQYVKHPDTRYRTRKLVSFGGYFIIVVAISVIYSDQLGGLTVALGVAGAGIAFALQELIASVAGWVAISFGNFYETGDRVQLGGIKGDVIDIGVLRTTLMECGQWVDGDLYNGRIVRIANSFVFKEPVFNYSADFPFLWDEIKIPVKYGSDYTQARQVLSDVAEEVVGDYSRDAQQSWSAMVDKYMIEPATTLPMITMIANDNWVEFTIRFVVDFKKRRTTKDSLFLRILEEFDKSGGRITMASATFQLVEAPVVDVRLTSK